MVLKGQDAWRKHPLLAGCWKAPLPGLGLAFGIFVGYCFLEQMFLIASSPPSVPHRTKYVFSPSGTLSIGDTMPEKVRKLGQGAHH